MPTPEVNQPVLLAGEEGEYASRVEDLSETGLTLARPFGLPLDTELDEGLPFEVRWTTSEGLYALPVRVTERSIDGKIRIWHAAPVGAARVINRRSHVRVPVALPMTIEYAGETIEAGLLDVSEAALRCQVSKPLPDPANPVDPVDPVNPVDLHGTPEAPGDGSGHEAAATVRFTLSGMDFDLDGTVFRSTPTRSVVELVITLPDDDRTATMLRRAVFAEQIRARQLSR